MTRVRDILAAAVWAALAIIGTTVVGVLSSLVTR